MASPILKLSSLESVTDEKFITPGGYDIRLPIEHDLKDSTNEYINDIEEIINSPLNPLHYDKLLTEAISYLDRCISNREKSRELRDNYYQTIVNYNEFEALNQVILKEIDAGLLNREITLENNKTSSINKALDIIDNTEGKSTEIEIIQKLLLGSLDNSGFISGLEEELKSLKIERNDTLSLYAKLRAEGTWAVDQTDGVLNRYDELKKSFNVDFSNAFHRIREAKKGIQHIFPNTFDQLIATFPNDNNQDLFIELKDWLRSVINQLKYLLVDDQTMQIPIGLAADCKDEVGNPWKLASLSDDDSSFVIPKTVFPNTTSRRLKSFGLMVRDNRNFRVQITPPDAQIGQRVIESKPVILHVKGNGQKIDLTNGPFANVDPAGKWDIKFLSSQNPAWTTDDLFYNDHHAHSRHLILMVELTCLPGV